MQPAIDQAKTKQSLDRTDTKIIVMGGVLEWLLKTIEERVAALPDEMGADEEFDLLDALSAPAWALAEQVAVCPAFTDQGREFKARAERWIDGGKF
jgi:hypothetical protein